ncbi:hypothetical protein L202_05128 [Cryptococcus amylolentus CBS 6039]|uniref:BZIP domain-containing protein n=1 Tax=Cryptococcus amylolentus CBS 6039 TaxID=1295533 RepID=A0A1E3HQP6_9TREE|nr:hypothetical protein L202_05128 [Cryptococcus amylolentus CBS 6039]ODN78046.1 hypothetical protein L202_05128 [Cryptococcus amylolentus CBS 6039]
MSFIDDIDWDSFLVETDLGEKISANVSPALSASALSNSTESDQSVALEPEPQNYNFGFGFGGAAFNTSSPTGMSHRLENMLSPETIQAQLTNFGLFSGFDSSPEVFPSQPLPAAPVQENTDLYAAITQLVGNAPMAVEPANLSLPASPVAPVAALGAKRKASDASDEGAPAPKRRGRPPGTGKPKAAVAPKRRVSKASPASSSVSPASSSEALPLDDFDDDMSPVRLTATGKPSTDRPKSVVPAKFLKDGSAQAILGMTIPEIMSFPTYEELLKKVRPELVAGATEFGEKIADNRDKAKDAAKKSRDERRAKIERAEYLERRCEELEGKVSNMGSFLMSLVDLNVLSKEQIRAFM